MRRHVFGKYERTRAGMAYQRCKRCSARRRYVSAWSMRTVVEPRIEELWSLPGQTEWTSTPSRCADVLPEKGQAA